MEDKVKTEKTHSGRTCANADKIQMPRRDRLPACGGPAQLRAGFPFG